MQGILLKGPPGSTQGEAPMEMGNGMVAMGMTVARSHDAQPETAVSLKDKHRLGRTLSVSLKQRHAELLCHFCSPGTGTQPTQNGVHLRKGDKRGFLRVRHQNHPVQPLNFIQEIFNRWQQRRQRKGQRESPRFLIISFISHRSQLSQANHPERLWLFKSAGPKAPSAPRQERDGEHSKTLLVSPALPEKHHQGSAAGWPPDRRNGL